MPTSERGFGYLLLLFGLALGGIALAAAGARWQVVLQREREADLLFRGLEIRAALMAYAARASASGPQYPARLEDLLADRRDGAPRHPLRRLYTDPFTGAADWRLLRGADGGIVGVASRSQAPAFARPGAPVQVRTQGGPETAPRVGDWRFMAGDTVGESETP